MSTTDKVLFGGGMLVLVATHAMMIFSGKLPANQVRGHAAVNLLAAAALGAAAVRSR